MKTIPNADIARIEPFDVLYTWLRPDVEPKDILELLSFVVRRGIQSATRGGPCHVVMMKDSTTFWEQTAPHAREGRIWEIDLDLFDVVVGYHARIREATEEGKKACRDFWRWLVTERVPYDYFELADHFEDRQGWDHLPDSDPERFVCSTAVEAATVDLLGQGFCPGQHPQLVDPADQLLGGYFIPRFSVGESYARFLELNQGKEEKA